MVDHRHAAVALLSYAELSLAGREEGDPNVTEVENQWRIRVRLGYTSSDCPDTRRAQEGQGRRQTIHSLIEHMIVCYPKHTEAGCRKDCSLVCRQAQVRSRFRPRL